MITQEILKQKFDLDPFGRLVRKIGTSSAPKGSYSTCKDKDGYLVVGVNGKQYRAHRLVWMYIYGEFPSEDIDHINRIKDDNRPENLRLVSKSQSRQNIQTQRNNKSGYKGVWLHKNTKKWCASIQVKGKGKHLGSFLTREEAAAAYIAASKIIHDFNIF